MDLRDSETVPMRKSSALPHSRLAGLLAGAALLLGASVTLHGAELRLRGQCQPSGPLVMLGDVAEIFSTETGQSQSLAAVELFPAPPASQQRFVRLREIQDALLLRGVNLVEHQFSGASQVTVAGAGAPSASPQAGALPQAAVQKAKQQVRDAITRYLREQAGPNAARGIDFSLDEKLVRLLTARACTIAVAGGSPPWTGAQNLDLAVGTPEGPVRYPLTVDCAVPSAIVMTTRPLARGAVIHESDVQLQQPASPEDLTDALRSVQDVVGQETTRAIAAGKPLSADAVRPKVLVRRGEVITVYARSAGLRVRTTARARDDGSQGDVITVESLLDRHAYFVRVSGPQEAEIDARTAAAAARFDDAKPPRIVRR